MSKTTSGPPADLIQVGRVVGAYGVRGWLKIEPFGDDVIAGAKTLWISAPPRRQPGAGNPRPSEPAAVPYVVQQIREHSGSFVAQLQGVPDRDAAHGLKASVVSMSRADFPPPEADEYYWVDLIGCEVRNEQGDVLGTISELEDHGADPVMRIRANATDTTDTTTTSRATDRLIPFVDAYVNAVDISARCVQVDWDPAWDDDAANGAGQ